MEQNSRGHDYDCQAVAWKHMQSNFPDFFAVIYLKPLPAKTILRPHSSANKKAAPKSI